jgi:hypothetical protein
MPWWRKPLLLFVLRIKKMPIFEYWRQPKLAEFKSLAQTDICSDVFIAPTSNSNNTLASPPETCIIPVSDVKTGFVICSRLSIEELKHVFGR